MAVATMGWRGRLAAAALGVAAATPAAAQNTAMELQTVDMATAIQDRRGATVPRDVELTDSTGAVVHLGDFLTGDRPVILNLGYYGCPALCGVVLNGLVDGLRGLTLELGRDFRIVSVSIDAKETPDLAARKKASFLAELGKPGAEADWHFTVGAEDQVRKLADTVGFGYQWNRWGKQYDHSAGIFVLSPDGVLSQVLQGADYRPRDLRLALVEASDGRIGTTWDRILLTCYGYDPQTRSYNLMVWTVLRIAGGLTVLGLGGMIFMLWRRERRRVAMAAS